MIVIGIVRSAKHAEIGENGIVTVVINVCSPFHLSIFSRNLNSVLGTYGQSFPCQRCGGDDDDDDEDDDDLHPHDELQPLLDFKQEHERFEHFLRHLH